VDTAALALLAAGVVAGHIVRIDTGAGNRIPLSYAAVLVLVTGFPGRDAAAALVGAALALVLVRPRRETLRGLAVLLPGAAAAGVTFHWVVAAGGRPETASLVVGALVAAAAVMMAVHVVGMAWPLPGLAATVLTRRAGLAWLALWSAGVLMAIGRRGVDGHGRVGLAGVLLFALPLLVTWYGFDRFEIASRTYRQTIEALAVTPELAGLVRSGHAERVAALCEDVAGVVGLGDRERADLRSAALLHHLGVVTLEDPEVTGEPHVPTLVAHVTAGTLEEIDRLAPAAGVIRGSVEPVAAPLPSRILRVASDFDDLTEGRAERGPAAVEALRALPGYVYDPTVLDALEVVVGRA
jgi:hypothetical protein